MFLIVINRCAECGDELQPGEQFNIENLCEDCFYEKYYSEVMNGNFEMSKV